MRVGIFLILMTICHAELQQGQRMESEAGVLKEEVRNHYSGPINKPQTRAGKLGIVKKKALVKAKARARASAAGSTQAMDSSIASQATTSNATQVIIEADTPLASLWYPPPSNQDEWKTYFELESDQKGVKNSLPSPDTQCVYLDFNQLAPYSVSIINISGDKVGEFGPFHGYHYNKIEQEAILDRLNRDYHLFNVYFTLEKPKKHDEPYTTIQFNANDFPGTEFAITTVVTPPHGVLEVFSVLFGLAPGIDYLNLIRDEFVRVNGNLWSFLVEIDPTGSLFTKYSGIPYLPGAVSRATINQSSNTASHELGHTLGLRHHDAFGSPGDGLPETGVPSVNAYYAPYPGPTLADETILHLMASSAVLGIDALNFPNHAQDDRFFSERSSVKLSFAEGCGHFMTEKEAKEYGTAIDGMEISEFFVQNSVMEGENSGGRYLRIDSVNIAGSIDYKNEVDRYRLYLKKDRVFSTEVISYTSTLDDRVMTTLTLLKVSDDGRRQIVAANDFGLEGFDPHIIDVVVPETGTYVLAVAVQQTIPIDRNQDGTFDELFSVKKLGGEDFLTGEYNLLIYNHHDPIQKARYRPDEDVCMKTKKEGYGSSSYHSGDYYSDHSSDSYSDHSGESPSDSHSGRGDSSTSDNKSYSEDAKNLRGTPSGVEEGHSNSPIKWQGHE